MKSRITLQLLVVAGLLALGIWLAGPGHDSKVGGGPRKLLSGMAADDIIELEIELGPMSIRCERGMDGWTMTSPVKARADSGAVGRIIDMLEDLPRGEVVTATQREKRLLKFDDYELGTKPRARIVVADSTRRLSLLVGRNSPLGDSVYVRWASEPEIIGTWLDLLAVLPSDANALLEKQVMPGHPGKVARLVVERSSGGYLEIARESDRWVMKQPVSNVRLRSDRIDGFLEALFSLQAIGVIAPEQAGYASLEEAAAPLRISIWEANDSLGRKLLVGEALPDGKVPVRVSGNDLSYVVDGLAAETLNIKTDDLRERKIFPVQHSDVVLIRFAEGDNRIEFRKSGTGWIIAEPTQCRADPDVMKEMIDELVMLEADTFVDSTILAPEAAPTVKGSRTIEVDRFVPETVEVKTPAPAGSVEVGSNGANGRSDSARFAGTRLLVGDAYVAGGGYYARTETDSTIMFMGPNGGLKRLLEGRYAAVQGTQGQESGLTGGASVSRWVNPLLYMDRLMMEIDPGAIVSLALSRDGKEQSVARGQDGTWRATVPSSGSVDNRAVDGIVKTVSALKAMRIEIRQNERLESYGLVSPPVTLTIGLEGNSGIRRTLLIGYKAGVDGVYASTQGQTAVFVLSSETARLLMRDIVAGVSNGP